MRVTRARRGKYKHTMKGERNVRRGRTFVELNREKNTILKLSKLRPKFHNHLFESRSYFCNTSLVPSPISTIYVRYRFPVISK